MAVNARNARPDAGPVPVAVEARTWAGRYVGIPYVARGFDRSGCHCFGLVHLVYREHLGIELPSHDGIDPSDSLSIARAFRQARLTTPWREVTGPRRDFDLVLMLQGNVPMHVGIAVGSRRILHVEEGVCAMCIDAGHPFYRHRIVGTYRHERLI